MIAVAVLGQVGQQGVDPVSHALLYPRRFYSADELRALRPLISDFDRGPANNSTGSETAVNAPAFNAENEQNYAISYEGSRDPVSTRPLRYKSLFATEADLDKGHEGAPFSLYHEYEQNPALRVYGAQLTAPTLQRAYTSRNFSVPLTLSFGSNPRPNTSQIDSRLASLSEQELLLTKQMDHLATQFRLAVAQLSGVNARVLEARYQKQLAALRQALAEIDRQRAALYGNDALGTARAAAPTVEGITEAELNRAGDDEEKANLARMQAQADREQKIEDAKDQLWNDQIDADENSARMQKFQDERDLYHQRALNSLVPGLGPDDFDFKEWKEYKDKDNNDRRFLYNRFTGESKWADDNDLDAPPPDDPEDVKHGILKHGASRSRAAGETSDEVVSNLRAPPAEVKTVANSSSIANAAHKIADTAVAGVRAVVVGAAVGGVMAATAHIGGVDVAGGVTAFADTAGAAVSTRFADAVTKAKDMAGSFSQDTAPVSGAASNLDELLRAAADSKALLPLKDRVDAEIKHQENLLSLVRAQKLDKGVLSAQPEYREVDFKQKSRNWMKNWAGATSQQIGQKIADLSAARDVMWHYGDLQHLNPEFVSEYLKQASHPSRKQLLADYLVGAMDAKQTPNSGYLSFPLPGSMVTRMPTGGDEGGVSTVRSASADDVKLTAINDPASLAAAQPAPDGYPVGSRPVPRESQFWQHWSVKELRDYLGTPANMEWAYQVVMGGWIVPEVMRQAAAIFGPLVAQMGTEAGAAAARQWAGGGQIAMGRGRGANKRSRQKSNSTKRAPPRKKRHKSRKG
jgi:hypothetical protein